ncbi:hypothetical protein VPH35_069553 [Triticum aestivum]
MALPGFGYFSFLSAIRSEYTSYRIWRPTYARAVAPSALAYLPVHYPVTRLPHPSKPDAIQNSTQLQLHRPAEPRPPHRRAWISRFLHDSPMNLGGESESFTDLLFRFHKILCFFLCLLRQIPQI